LSTKTRTKLSKFYEFIRINFKNNKNTIRKHEQWQKSGINYEATEKVKTITMLRLKMKFHFKS